MTIKLVQKQFLKGSREFELDDEVINFRIKKGLKEEKLTVDLSILNPEPVVNEPFLEFHSRIKCGPMFSLLIDKPNAQEYNAFVDALKQRARQQYNSFAGLKSGSHPEGLNGNVYEEPPEFGEPDNNRPRTKVIPVRVDETIQMLQLHLDGDEIEALVTALEALKSAPEDEASFAQLLKAFDDLGPRQGAVLTYAPYVSLLLSDDPFGF
ncbi:hypothetical protein N8198_07920 [Gammaproteobacteria bacterium]|nr:hypothetical protein [Gammaproteobacteria bacterium]